MRREVLGHSHGNQEILGYTLQGLALTENRLSGRHPCLILGGTHGDERATVPLLHRFLENMKTELPEHGDLYVLPCLNPDGYALNSRYNGRHVDLNRNFETAWRGNSEEPPGPYPLSENESRLLKDLVLHLEPACIISLHWALAELDGDGQQSLALVKAMWESLEEADRISYRWRLSPSEPQDEGQGPPGSFGRWAGHGVLYADGIKPAMVTLELPFRPYAFARPDPLHENHLLEVKRAWETDSEGYLNYAYGGLERMLAAAMNYQVAGGYKR